MDTTEEIIYGFIVYKEPVENVFQYAADHGIKHLEIDLIKKHSLLGSFTPKRIEIIRNAAQKHGIRLGLHPPYNLSLCGRFPFIRKRNISYLKKALRLAHRLGAGYLTLHVGDFNRSAISAHSRHYSLQRAVKSLAVLLEECEKYNVNLALENVIPLPLEAGYSFVGDNLDDFHFIFSRLNSPHLKVCLDIGHANTSEGPIAYVDALGDHIINVHYHDNNGKCDDHLNVGEGTVQWPELLAALGKRGFRGPFVSECFKTEPHRARQQLAEMFEQIGQIEQTETI